MTGNIRYLHDTDRIAALYRKSDTHMGGNVEPFRAPLSPKLNALLEDAEVLLLDPETQNVMENALRCALSLVATYALEKNKGKHPSE